MPPAKFRIVVTAISLRSMAVAEVQVREEAMGRVTVLRVTVTGTAETLATALMVAGAASMARTRRIASVMMWNLERKSLVLTKGEPRRNS